MEVEIKDLLEAGAHFGHKVEKWNPKMKSFIYTKKSGIHIIDLTKTKEKLDEALNYIKKETGEGKTVLFIGTKKQAQDIVKEEAERAGMPYVNERWLGGTLTNFQTVIKQVKKLLALRDEKEKEEWNNFSKKERTLKQKELERLEKSIGGLEKLRELPNILFIIDIAKEHLAVKEARRLNIPIVAIADSNTDPNLADYPIPANDDALKVIKLITSAVSDSITGVKPAEKEDKDFKEEETEEEKLKIKEDVEEIEEKLEEKMDEEEIENKKIASAKTSTLLNKPRT